MLMDAPQTGQDTISSVDEPLTPNMFPHCLHLMLCSALSGILGHSRLSFFFIRNLLPSRGRVQPQSFEPLARAMLAVSRPCAWSRGNSQYSPSAHSLPYPVDARRSVASRPRVSPPGHVCRQRATCVASRPRMIKVRRAEGTPKCKSRNRPHPSRSSRCCAPRTPPQAGHLDRTWWRHLHATGLTGKEARLLYRPGMVEETRAPLPHGGALRTLTLHL